MIKLISEVMELIQAIVLGIVEGLTEFLPVSSTGHLIVAQDMLGFYDTTKMFTVVIQMGAIAAVIWYYRQQLRQLVTGLIKNDKKVKKFWLIWVLATIPAGIAGLLLDAKIEAYSITLTVAIALIVGGILIWLIETYHKVPKAKDENKGLEQITASQAIKIGFYQVLALVPGVSRSGATIIGGLLSGLDRVSATSFSFYLGMPILLLAGILKLATEDVSTVDGGMAAIAIGLISSFFTSLIVIGWLLRYVSKNSFKVFAYYRIGFGILLLILLNFGVLS